MAQYLTAANIYVSTSFIDSTSVSLLEAMACGIPPVTTDISGNREWIKNEVNGLLYQPRDHKALAEKITQLIENEDLRKQFGERSRQMIMERAKWEKCVSKMEAIYNSIY
jgi:glycosyltransferase involved in cell wall biosynthesis